MVQIKSDGALTIVRRIRKDGRAKGVMTRNNLDEAISRGNNNVVLSKKVKK